MTGTAVLVHGGWGSPTDWKWVAQPLQAAGTTAVAVDLPSHRSPTDHRPEDIEEVRRAIRAAQPPVVVAGWSYGTGVVCEAATIDAAIAGLVCVASVPRPVDPDPEDAPPPGDFDLDHLVFGDDGTQVLDNGWWLTEGDVTSCPADVMAHLRATPRRPFSAEAALAPLQGAAWEDLPTIVMLGRSDPLVPPSLQAWCVAHHKDVRLLDSDHFIIWRQPEVIVDAILELAATTRS